MPKSSELPRNDRDFINRLFEQLQAIFPAWRAAFPNDAAVAEAKRQWTAGLVQNSVTDIDSIKGGLRIARRSESPFLPSVGQFVGWCREAKLESMSLPTISEVQELICRYAHERQYPPSRPDWGTKITPLAYWVYRNMDYHRWRREPAERADKILSAAYDRAVNKAVSGFEFPGPPVLIDKQASPAEPSPAVRQAAADAREALKSMMRVAVSDESEQV